jgi:hypothetical protein
MKIIKLALVLGALAMTMAGGCGRPEEGCARDDGGNVDCPVRQHNPVEGLVNDPR